MEILLVIIVGLLVYVIHKLNGLDFLVRNEGERQRTKWVNSKRKKWHREWKALTEAREKEATAGENRTKLFIDELNE